MDSVATVFTVLPLPPGANTQLYSIIGGRGVCLEISILFDYTFVCPSPPPKKNTQEGGGRFCRSVLILIYSTVCPSSRKKHPGKGGGGSINPIIPLSFGLPSIWVMLSCPSPSQNQLEPSWKPTSPNQTGIPFGGFPLHSSFILGVERLVATLTYKSTCSFMQFLFMGS